MLQQTQVERVVGKYSSFLKMFPDFATLSRTPLPDLLAAWQGLGYNRRAVALKRCAEAVVAGHDAHLPDSVAMLEKLPGIGHYTARAVAAFAFNRPTVFIETNIRAVFIHHFCSDRDGVKDTELLPMIAATLDQENPRDWYNALMDYGVMLKRAHRNPARRSAHHTAQSPFRGSNRELRSRILQALLTAPGTTAGELSAVLNADESAVRTNLEQMAKEGFLSGSEEGYRIR
jgi:A/G-specific adenine glycosylase